MNVYPCYNSAASLCRFTSFEGSTLSLQAVTALTKGDLSRFSAPDETSTERACESQRASPVPSLGVKWDLTGMREELLVRTRDGVSSHQALDDTI